MKAILALEDGTIYEGQSVGALGTVYGEVVFNTAMCGYQEQLTDPNYEVQLVTFTYPLLGNYGVNSEDFASDRTHAKGIIIKELCNDPANFRMEGLLGDYLKEHGIVAIADVDTRALTRLIREKGTMCACITTEESFDFAQHADAIKSAKPVRPVMLVTSDEVKTLAPTAEANGLTVAVINYGVKQNMLDCFTGLGCNVVVFPATATMDEVKAVAPNAIFLSNGPGDPKDYPDLLGLVKDILKAKIPTLAVGLGHQLVALASGFDTAPLKYGHRGVNHPVKDVQAEVVFATTQNCGYTVCADSIDKKVAAITHVNMHDGMVEGLSYKKVPVISTQFHPDTGVGPCPLAKIYKKFVDSLLAK